MHGWPNRRNEAAFSNYSSVVLGIIIIFFLKIRLGFLGKSTSYSCSLNEAGWFGRSVMRRIEESKTSLRRLL